MSVEALVNQMNQAIPKMLGVQDVVLPNANNPFEFYGSILLDRIPKSDLPPDVETMMTQLANFYVAIGGAVDNLGLADRFQSQSSVELLAISRLALDRPRLKQLIGTLLYVDEMLDAAETQQQQAAAASS